MFLRSTGICTDTRKIAKGKLFVALKGPNFNANEFAEQALTNERAKLSRGATTNFVVLQLQRNLTAARSEEIQSLTDYNKSLARLRFVEGSNLSTYQIDLTQEK